MHNLLRASAQWLVLESAVFFIDELFHVCELTNRCVFALICSSQQVWEGFFYQFFPMLPLLSLSNLGNCCIFGYLTVGFVLGSTTYISPGLFPHLCHSSAVLEKVFLASSKLAKFGEVHIHICFSCRSIFLCFSQSSSSPNSSLFGPFLKDFLYRLCKRLTILMSNLNWYSDCELAIVYDFKERISHGQISYFLCSCLLHLLQLSCGLARLVGNR